MGRLAPSIRDVGTACLCSIAQPGQPANHCLHDVRMGGGGRMTIPAAQGGPEMVDKANRIGHRATVPSQAGGVPEAIRTCRRKKPRSDLKHGEESPFALLHVAITLFPGFAMDHAFPAIQA